MSSGVTQVKKRFAEMATYLHKDEKGQQLLKLLKDDVNVLRKSLAAADAAKDAAVMLMETARQRADKAEVAAASLAESTKRLQDQLNSLQSQVALLTQRLEAEDDDDDEDDDAIPNAKYAAAMRTMKRLRRLMPKCPPSLLLDRLPPDVFTAEKLVLDRASIATGWSYQDIWLIGATVSVVCAVQGSITVVAYQRLFDMNLKGKGDDLVQATMGFGHSFVHWMGKHLDRRDENEIRKELLATPFRKGKRRTAQDTARGLGLADDTEEED